MKIKYNLTFAAALSACLLSGVYAPHMSAQKKGAHEPDAYWVLIRSGHLCGDLAALDMPDLQPMMNEIRSFLVTPYMQREKCAGYFAGLEHWLERLQTLTYEGKQIHVRFVGSTTGFSYLPQHQTQMGSDSNADTITPKNIGRLCKININFYMKQNNTSIQAQNSFLLSPGSSISDILELLHIIRSGYDYTESKISTMPAATAKDQLETWIQDHKMLESGDVLKQFGELSLNKSTIKRAKIRYPGGYLVVKYSSIDNLSDPTQIYCFSGGRKVWTACFKKDPEKFLLYMLREVLPTIAP